MFRPTGQEVQKINGAWYHRAAYLPDNGFLRGSLDWQAEVTAEFEAGEMTDTLAEQYTRQGLPLPEGKG